MVDFRRASLHHNLAQAKSRRLALVEGQHGEGMFRRMLPETPVGSAALAPAAPNDEES